MVRGPLFFIFLLSLASKVVAGRNNITDPACFRELGERGWRCKSGECISLDWICDGFEQCEDNSDESKDPNDGCNLYPDSKCYSFGGRRYYFCEVTGDCFQTPEAAAECNAGEPPTVSDCGSDDMWKCRDGRCIKKSQLCDRYPHCLDRSDEKEGCRLYPPEVSGGCSSVRGELLVPCSGMPSICTTPHLSLMANASYQETGEANTTLCRLCNSPDEWRCDDGRCIAQNLTNDGVPHCLDGSDEHRISIQWWVVLIITVCMVVFGLLISFGCRIFHQRNWDEFFHCNLCSSSNRKGTLKNPRKNRMPTAPPLDPVSGQGDSSLEMTPVGKRLARARMPDAARRGDDLEGAPLKGDVDHTDGLAYGEDDAGFKDQLSDDDVDGICEDCGVDETFGVKDDDDIKEHIPIDLIRLLEDKKNWISEERENIFSKMAGHNKRFKCLKDDVVDEARQKYAYLHGDPLQYHHLYSYIVNRSASVKDLATYTNLLFSYEKEIHLMNKVEVLKCWRLNLGSSAMTWSVINSVCDEPSIASRVYTSLLPVRDLVRKIRRTICKAKPRQDSNIFKAFTTVYFAILPFIEGSLFYFETIKNMVYTRIVYSALYDLSVGQPTQFPFEFFLFLLMVISIVLVQILFAVYSFIHCYEIFEVAHERSCPKSRLRQTCFKILSVILSPLVPCYVLANHIYYTAKMDRERRHLQMYKEEFEKDEDDCEVAAAEVNLQPQDKTEEHLQTKIEMYLHIRKLELKSLLYRKIYSYYRVTSAVIESTTFLVVLVLLMFVTGRKGRSISLITGVEHRLRSFFSLTAYSGSFIDELNLVRDLVIGLSLIYSFFMVTTAFVKYWYQAKSQAIIFKGQLVLWAYMSALTFNKLTTFISIFSFTQPLLFDNGLNVWPEQEPKLGLDSAIATFLGIILVHVAVVFVYKWRCSMAWKDCGLVDRWINVLINLIVIVPTMCQTNPLQQLKAGEKLYSSSPEKTRDRRTSLMKRNSLLRITSVIEEYRDRHPALQEPVETEENQRTNIVDILIPDMTHFVSPFVYSDLRDEIKDMWWRNPRRNLDVEYVTNNLSGPLAARFRSLKNEEFKVENIRITLEQLKLAGMVNVPLLNPTPTKREYCWLWLINIVENGIALSLEVYNGGVWTSQGHYYSWDIRVASSLLAFIFLLAYYRFYHVFRDITSVGPKCGGWLPYVCVCCFCSKDVALSAKPDEMAMERMMEGKKKCVVRVVETQTDITWVKGKDFQHVSNLKW